ncbi:MAG: DUF4350 domain-containing protein [Chloroflexota bacterium]
MSKLSRDNWFAIGLFVVLVIVLAVATIQEVRSQTVDPPLASFSNQPDGARAFWLWLQALDYETSDLVRREFGIPEEAQLMLLLEPQTVVTPNEWEAIDEWVEDGGILLLSGRSFASVFAMEHYDFSLAQFEEEHGEAVAQSTLFHAPSLLSVPETAVRAYFETERTDYVTHVAVDGQPIIISFPQGEGRVMLSTTPFPFTNAGLQKGNNAELVHNLVQPVGPDGLVWFDEWHHGVRPTVSEGLGPWNWLRETAAGRSLLFVAGLVFLVLVLRGRPFGRPVPLPQDISRRAPVEYIAAMANLNRRAGHRTAVLQDYHDRLKRHLGQPYRLDPALTDAEFVAALAKFEPSLAQRDLLHLLHKASKKSVSEVELVEIAAETAVWLDK